MKQFSLLIRPIVTEKSLREASVGKYIFEVDDRTNKVALARFVEKAYKVHVESVNILNISGKERRRGRSVGRTKDYKKAIITLKKGEKIPGFEIKEAPKAEKGKK